MIALVGKTKRKVTMLEEEIMKLRYAVEALTAQLAGAQTPTVEEPVEEGVEEPVEEPVEEAVEEAIEEPVEPTKDVVTAEELHALALSISREKGPKVIKDVLAKYGAKRIGAIDAKHYAEIKAALEAEQG
jgi:hypothetical protein